VGEGQHAMNKVGPETCPWTLAQIEELGFLSKA
jgi:hypothetical protein